MMTRRCTSSSVYDPPGPSFHRLRRLLTAFTLVACTAVPSLAPPAGAQNGDVSNYDRLARDIFRQLVEINTTDSVGNTTEAAEAMADRLRQAGLPPREIQVLGPHPRKGNLVARLKGRDSGQRPVLLLAHLDVVEAQPEDWTVSPFEFLERDGYYWGRGTTDDKAMSAIWITNLIRYHREGYSPARDIVVALTADEEGGQYNGVRWLLAEHPDLIAAEFTLNEGGGGAMKNGRKLFNAVQASEKVYQSFRLEVQNPGGHSSLPVKDNAIYHLARGLVRIADYDFPVELNEVTREFFERTAAIESGQVAADMRAILKTPPDPKAAARLSIHPHYNARLRTTCVATRLDAGHADNALPQRARAVVNCRILPGQPPAQVLSTLVQVVADRRIGIQPMNQASPSPPSPLTPEILEAIEEVTSQMWPGVPVIPIMSTGATDGLYLRQHGTPVYGVSGLFGDVDDVRAHGQDERIGVQEFHEGQEFLYRLVKALTSSR